MVPACSASAALSRLQRVSIAARRTLASDATRAASVSLLSARFISATAGADLRPDRSSIKVRKRKGTHAKS